MIQIKRVYEDPDKQDGFRILVDRIWPRGVSKEEARVDLWLKDIGPTTELRKWFGHEVPKWEGFRKKYQAELREKQNLLDEIKKQEKEHTTVTLLFGAKDEDHNQAVVIRDVLGENNR
ncbi:MAG: DUF488 domain-containing protein [Candidatus Levyibacteriota bacterium]